MSEYTDRVVLPKTWSEAAKLAAFEAFCDQLDAEGNAQTVGFSVQHFGPALDAALAAERARREGR